MLTPALAAVSMMLPILLWRADTCAWIGESVGSTTWFWISPIFTWNVCNVKVPIYCCVKSCYQYLSVSSVPTSLAGLVSSCWAAILQAATWYPSSSALCSTPASRDNSLERTVRGHGHRCCRI